MSKITKANTVFDEVFLSMQPRLVNYVSRYAPMDTAKDIVQEAFLKVWKKYRNLEWNDLVRLVFTTTRNLTLDYLKSSFKSVSSKSVELEHAELMYNFDFLLDSTDTPFLRQELNRQIEQLRLKLPPRCKDVFELRFIEGMKNEDIAAKLGISRTMVEKHLRTARAAFAAIK